jgi:hypothetical protein
MELKDAEGWARAKAANTDPYGGRVISYAEDWANFMEREMATGKTVAECAKPTSREADTDGITGFMYGAAVSILAAVWAHGEDLRRWHNLDIQIGTEGEKANESGGTLNPALLNIG